MAPVLGRAIASVVFFGLILWVVGSYVRENFQQEPSTNASSLSRRTGIAGTVAR